MVEYYTKEKLTWLLKTRELFSNPHIKEFEKSDVIILHCPFDLAIAKNVDKPVILYDHRAGRPTTFMWRYISKFIDPILRMKVERDRPWVINRVKQLYSYADVVLVNSRFIKEQLRKYYDVESHVVYPPTDLEIFHPTTENPKRNYFLSVQRINWQKRISLQVKAFEKSEEKLIIVGEHSDDLADYVENISNIEYLGKVSQRKLLNLYGNAKATIQTGYYEDFGMVPIESMACGTPVICVDEGGFKETVNPKVGVLIKKPYLKSLKATVEIFDNSRYSTSDLRMEAEKYSLKRFTKEMNKYMEMAVEKHGLHN